MKKTVLALLVVLLLGTFVACNGEVDFLLWDDAEEETTKTVSLDSYYLVGTYYYSFAEDEEDWQKTFTFNGTINTWEELAESRFTIRLYSTDANDTTFTDGYADFVCTISGDFVYFICDSVTSFCGRVSDDDHYAVYPSDSIDSSMAYCLFRIDSV